MAPVGLTQADPAKPSQLPTGTPAHGCRDPSCPVAFRLQPTGWICLGLQDPENGALSVPRHPVHRYGEYLVPRGVGGGVCAHSSL